MRIGIAGKGAFKASSEQPWNLVFLIETSDELPILRPLLSFLVEKMKPRDSLSIVAISDDTEGLISPTSIEKQESLYRAIQLPKSDNTTLGAPGIKEAYRLARKGFLDGAINEIVLATNENLNVGIGDLDEFVSLVSKERKSGIRLSTLGFGYSPKEILKKLADYGGGDHFHIDSLDEAQKALKKKLASNLQTIAKDVKVQVDFNPNKIVRYRLLGYDNLEMKSKGLIDKRLATKDVRADHNLTVLYELTLTDSPLGQLRRKRNKHKPTKDNRGPELAQLNLP